MRQAGLHIGVELVKDPSSREPHAELLVRVRKEGFRYGIFFGVGGTEKNVLKIKPPLIITPEEARTVLERFHASLEAALK